MNFKIQISCIVLSLLTTVLIAADPVIGIGIAIWIDQENETPLVVQVIPNSPAEKAGLPQGAIIEKINGVSTAGRTLEQCIAQIRGPEGIPILLEFIDPTTGQSKKIMIVREKLKLES